MPFTAGSDQVSGDVIVFAQVGVGVVIGTVASGDEGVLQMMGVFLLAKEAPLVMSQGDRLYWDAGAKKFTKTVGSNMVAGFAYADATSAATSVEIMLIPMADSDPGQLAQAAVVADLAGTLTGSTDDTIADVADIALSTSDTYTDAAVNTAVNAAILDLNLQLKELHVKQKELTAALKTAGLMATS